MNGKTKGIKKMRNENASIYMCVNLTNGKIYIGSASKGYLYDRYRAHLFLAKKQGSKIVNKAVMKYGIDNFAFVILEYVKNEKVLILEREQYYIDLLKPAYNIAKIAGSVMGIRRSMEQRIKLSINMRQDHINKIIKAHTGKTVSVETRELIRQAALGRIITSDTRIKISDSNAKKTEILLFENNELKYTFPSIAKCALHFFNDDKKRGAIRWSISSGKPFINKYIVKQVKLSYSILFYFITFFIFIVLLLPPSNLYRE